MSSRRRDLMGFRATMDSEKGTQVASDALPVRAVLGSGPFCLVKLHTVRQVSVGIVRPHVVSLILSGCPDGVSLVLETGFRGVVADVICGVFQIVRNGLRGGLDIIGYPLGWAGVACGQRDEPRRHRDNECLLYVKSPVY
jgi:hypothetical protein